MTEAKRIPYGVSDFITMMTENYYYVDKTKYIPDIERQPDFLFFTRPRRFGKSLWINMLAAYYDCFYKNRFEELFGNLWIGSHKTAQQGQYLMLALDLSKVRGDLDGAESDFNNYLSLRLDNFMDKYEDKFTGRVIKRFDSAENARDKLTIIDDAAKTLGLKLFLIVDEYDNFTNTILNKQGEAVYHAITHADGFYRDVFKKFKGMFRRIILTGVSPVTLDDLTSGFNIGWSMTMAQSFNQMLGFSEEEVREMFAYYKSENLLPEDFDIDEKIAEIKPWYNGYCFSERAIDSQSRVFNSDMVLRYLHNYVDEGCEPKSMVDPNAGTDYTKLNKLLQLDKLDGDRKGVLHRIIEDGQIKEDVMERFPANTLTNPKMFTSLLFYYGMLTFKGTEDDSTILEIPNNNVRKLYYEYLAQEYAEDSKINISQLEGAFTRMACDGDWKPAIQYLADAYAKVSSVRDGIEGERNIQGFFMAYLSVCNKYLLAPELELNHGYCDFFLLPDPRYKSTRHSYIIELKYLPKKDWTETVANAQWDEAVKQINGYAAAPRVEALRNGTELHKIVVQFCGWEIRRMAPIDN